MKKSELQQIIREEIVRVLRENTDLMTFKQLIDKRDIKNAAKLYLAGDMTKEDAREALGYVKSKGLEKQFDTEVFRLMV